MTDFQAALFTQVGGPLAIETVRLDAPGPKDVVVRLRASGLCHTELEIMQGQIAVPRPMVMGHEGAGIVEAVGADVTRVRPGDHVVLSWNPNCGHCFYCVRDQPILCETIGRVAGQGMMPDGTPRFRRGGDHIYQFSYVASHAEYTVVAEVGAIPIPRDMPFDRACLIGCGVMTGVGGALRIARVSAGSSTVTFGCGAVGLNAIQGARLAHAQVNIAVDVNPGRLALAQTMGATHLIDARQEDPVAAVLRLTHGRGADYGFEAAGKETAMQNTISAVRRGGMVVVLGKIPFDQYFRVQFGTFFGEKVLTRSSYGGARPARDFPMLAQAYLDGDLKLDELISSRIKLPDINIAFDGMARGEIIRSVVVFE